MKKALLITCVVLLGSIQAMALSEQCEKNLVLSATESIIQNHQEKLVNLNLKAATVIKLDQSRLDGNVWVDSIIVDIPVKYEIGSYTFTTSFDMRGGKCASAKLVGKITKRANNYGNDGGGQTGD